MNKNFNNNRKGFSAIEVVIAIVVSSIVMLGISGVLASSQRGWNRMYNHIYSNVVTNAHIAKRAFDGIVRKSSSEGLLIDGDGKWIEVSYYQSDASAQLDRYARFFYDDEEKELYVEYGGLNPKETTNTAVVCRNVTNCVFKQSGRSVHMLMTINNGMESQTIGTSDQLHN